MSDQTKKPEKKTPELLEKEKEILTNEKEYIDKLNKELDELNPAPPKPAPEKIPAVKTELPIAKPPKVVVATEKDIQEYNARIKQKQEISTTDATVFALIGLVIFVFFAVMALAIMSDEKARQDRINAESASEMPILSIEKAIDVYKLSEYPYGAGLHDKYRPLIEKVFNNENVVKITFNDKSVFIHVDNETYKLIVAHKDSHDLVEIKEIKDKLNKK